MLCLTIEDMVANAIIELNRMDGSRKVSIDDALVYGKEVASCLRKRGYFTTLKLNSNLIEDFENRYSNFFFKYYDKDSYGYQLHDGIEVDEVVKEFRSPLVIELLDSFTDDDVLSNSFRNVLDIEHSLLKKKISGSYGKR